MTPFKLITVFLHEVSHALACWLTCGKVRTSSHTFHATFITLSIDEWLACSTIYILLNLRPAVIYINLQVEGIQVHADEGGVIQTRGGIYWII